MYKRANTIPVKVGNLIIGNQNRLVIQSMTNTKTSNYHATINQIKQLSINGCELVRVALLDDADLKSLSKIIKDSPLPIVADIHYKARYALQAIKMGVAAIRINPGNIADLQELKQIVLAAKAKEVAIRIGFNMGSLPKGVNNYIQLVDYAIEYIKLFES